MLVLPYNALCQEKAAGLQRLLAPLERKVHEAYGGVSGGKPLQPGVGEWGGLALGRGGRPRKATQWTQWLAARGQHVTCNLALSRCVTVQAPSCAPSRRPTC